MVSILSDVYHFVYFPCEKNSITNLLFGSLYVESLVGDALVKSSFLTFCRHKVVIVEGNYLLLDEGVWKDISSMLDERW